MNIDGDDGNDGNDENISADLLSLNKAMTIILEQLCILILYQIDHLHPIQINKYNTQQTNQIGWNVNKISENNITFI